MPSIDEKTITELERLFEDSVAEVVPAVSGFPVSRGDGGANGGYMGVLPFHGEINGAFMLKTDERSLRFLAAYTTGCGAAEVQESDMTDLVGEMANMICGTARAKAAANGLRFSLSVPFSVKGPGGLEFFFKKNARTFALRFSSPDVRISTRVVL